jgi:hypothetical protein
LKWLAPFRRCDHVCNGYCWVVCCCQTMMLFNFPSVVGTTNGEFWIKYFFFVLIK